MKLKILISLSTQIIFTNLKEFIYPFIKSNLKKIPPVTNKPPTAIKIIKSKIDLSVFTFKKFKTKAIEGNNNIILGIIDSYHFF